MESNYILQVANFPYLEVNGIKWKFELDRDKVNLFS